MSSKPNDRKQQWRELSVARFGHPSNFGEQGADAGLYENSDIWGIRILVLEPVSDAIHTDKKGRKHFALGSNAEERIRIFKLAWDATGTQFGQRMLQYERYYAGDPVRVGASYYLDHDVSHLLAQVERALKGAG